MTTNSTLEVEGAKTIEQIRKDGIVDKELQERIAAERAEMQRIKDAAKERLPGGFLSLRQDPIHRAMAEAASACKGLCDQTGNPRKIGQ